MADPASAPGWYPDPWQRAERRWHDGTRWTEHVDGAAAAPPAGPFIGGDGNDGVEARTATPFATHVTPAAQPQITPEAALLLAGASSERMASQSSGRATAALITAILGIPLVPLVLGALALSEISSSAHHLRGAVKAWIAIGLGVLNLIAIFLVTTVAIPAALEEARKLTGPNGLQSPTAALGNARAVQAQATLRQVVVAMETCAAGSAAGSYTGCDTQTAQMLPQLADGLARCGSPGGTCITVLADGSFVVRVTDTADPPTTWSEQRSLSGQVTPACTGPACTTADAFA